MTAEHVDVLIVGAGLSGISAAYYLQTRCPTKSYALLEGRAAIGGTWDLFRYPGVRSDSDMHTLGYSFRPWQDEKIIADGPAILRYIRETAEQYGIDRNIRFSHRMRRAAWHSEDAAWAVEATGPDGQPVQFTCGFLFMCSGYYDYAQGHTPEWPGMERFAGRIIHPQHWPEDVNYAGKRVVVIGSGATAITLVPALAAQAAHVTMLQRSPTYVAANPSHDATTTWLRKHMPPPLAHRLARWRSLLLGMYVYRLARRRPTMMKRFLLGQIRKQLGPDYDIDTHFTPRYAPWDQRLCLAPDGDLFTAITSGAASVVTDQIDTLTETGIRLRSGVELAADIVVTATGLRMQLMSGVELVVDGVPVALSQTLSYKGMMYSDVPNLASAFGYTNASWTLKCELIAMYVCRLLRHMDRHGYGQCTPRNHDSALASEPALDLASGYVQRGVSTLPQQGAKKPWRIHQNYLLDLRSLRLGRVNDGVMEFVRRKQRPGATRRAA